MLYLVKLCLQLVVVLGCANLSYHPLHGGNILEDLLNVCTDVLAQPLQLSYAQQGIMESFAFPDKIRMKLLKIK